MSLEVKTIPAGPIQTNAYLIIDKERQEALLVDAPPDSYDIVHHHLGGAKLVALLLTHGHFDHLGNLAAFQKDGVPVYAHKEGEKLLHDPSIQTSMFGIDFEASKIDVEVKQDDILELMSQKIEVRFVPGHCPGSVLFYFSEIKEAFVGDAIFNGSIGRVDLPGGDFKTLEKSILEQIYTLPKDTILSPGHGPKTQVAAEMFSNAYVRSS